MFYNDMQCTADIVITFHNKLFYDFHLNVQRRIVPLILIRKIA